MQLKSKRVRRLTVVVGQPIITTDQYPLQTRIWKLYVAGWAKAVLFLYYIKSFLPYYIHIISSNNCLTLNLH